MSVGFGFGIRNDGPFQKKKIKKKKSNKKKANQKKKKNQKEESMLKTFLFFLFCPQNILAELSSFPQTRMFSTTLTLTLTLVRVRVRGRVSVRVRVRVKVRVRVRVGFVLGPFMVTMKLPP